MKHLKEWFECLSECTNNKFDKNSLLVNYFMYRTSIEHNYIDVVEIVRYYIDCIIDRFTFIDGKGTVSES